MKPDQTAMGGRDLATGPPATDPGTCSQDGTGTCSQDGTGTCSQDGAETCSQDGAETCSQDGGGAEPGARDRLRALRAEVEGLAGRGLHSRVAAAAGDALGLPLGREDRIFFGLAAAEALLHVGWAATDLRSFRAALPVLQGVLAQVDGPVLAARVLARLGEAALHGGDSPEPDELREFVFRYLQLEARQPEGLHWGAQVWFNLARAYDFHQRLGQAAKAYEQAASLLLQVYRATGDARYKALRDQVLDSISHVRVRPGVFRQALAALYPAVRGQSG